MIKLFRNVFILLLIPFAVSAQTVKIETILGDIVVQLRPDWAPVTVENFMNYVNDGDYNNSYVHRSVPNFVIQGGGFNFIDGVGGQVPTDSAIINESSVEHKNLRGTISMARTSSYNSATSQWFINVVDNPALNGDGVGYAVFGEVISGMDVVDAINDLQYGPIYLPTSNGNLYSLDVPYLNTKPSVMLESEAVMVSSVSRIDVFKINSGLSGLWHYHETSGSGIMLEVFPQIKKAFMAWFTYDTQLPDENTVANVGDAGHRWLTGIGDLDLENNSITFELTSTSGGLFDNPQDTQNSEFGTYGTLIITFNNCGEAQVSYNLIEQELSNTFPIEKVVSDNIPLCEGLYNQISE